MTEGLDEREHASRPMDPAADAAAMLLRLGFAIFALVIPSATLLSRWVIVVLVPIGAVLILLAALLKGDFDRISRAVGRHLVGVPGLTAVFFALWAAMSLAWTPDPGVAAEKRFKTLGVLAIGTLAVLALPTRMRASNLHLVTIGAGLGAVLVLATTVQNTAGEPFWRVPAATPGRVAVMLATLVWAAAAWLLIKDRRVLAVGLLLATAGAILLGPASREAVLTLTVGAAVFALAWWRPDRAGASLGAAFGALVLGAPLLAGLFKAIGFAGPGRWWDLAMADPLRLLAGRGYDAAATARVGNRLPGDLSVGFLTDLWYDLGLIGAIGFALLGFFALRAAGRLGLELAPAALAGISAALTYAVLERGATQTWWLNGLTVFAVVLLSVERGRYRTVRPRADLKQRRSGDSPPLGVSESRAGL